MVRVHNPSKGAVYDKWKRKIDKMNRKHRHQNQKLKNRYKDNDDYEPKPRTNKTSKV